MIRALKAISRWFAFVGRETPAGGRFSPLHAWEMAWYLAGIEPRGFTIQTRVGPMHVNAPRRLAKNAETVRALKEVAELAVLSERLKRREEGMSKHVEAS